MIPSCDHTGTPRHFHSSTTSGRACLMRDRTRASVSPRQSASSLIFASISWDAFLMVGAPSEPGGALDPARRPFLLLRPMLPNLENELKAVAVGIAKLRGVVARVVVKLRMDRAGRSFDTVVVAGYRTAIVSPRNLSGVGAIWTLAVSLGIYMASVPRHLNAPRSAPADGLYAVHSDRRTHGVAQPKPCEDTAPGRPNWSARGLPSAVSPGASGAAGRERLGLTQTFESAVANARERDQPALAVGEKSHNLP